MFYHSELQYRTLNGSIYAVHQSFSGFNTGVGQATFSTVVVGSVTVGIDSWRFATVRHLRHFIPDTSQPISRGSTVLLHSRR